MKMKESLQLIVIVLACLSNVSTVSAFVPSRSVTVAHNSFERIRGGALSDDRNPSTTAPSASAINNRHRRQGRTSVASVERKMGAQALVYGTAVAATFGMQMLGFCAAWILKTEVFYDIFGGLNYLLLAVLSAILGATGEGALPWIDDPRKILATVLFACSRGWLLLFLAWRAHERKGDARFDAPLGKNGHTPNAVQFLNFWIVQAMWVLFVSLPMLFVNSSSVVKPNFSGFDIATAILFGGGVLIEIVADIQKAIWVKRGRKGDFCEAGIWKYSRELLLCLYHVLKRSIQHGQPHIIVTTGHPNYFGEIFQWFMLWAFGYSSSGNTLGGYADPLWWLGIISPLFTMVILLTLEPTGICNAEGKNLKRYYDKCPERYAKYRENTSILIPFIGYGLVPKFLKRTIFFDFEKYEYKPSTDVAKEE